MIKLVDFWMGRDKRFAPLLTPEISRNGEDTVLRANKLIFAYFTETGSVVSDVSSGWRPPAINDATANAAAYSNHLVGAAVDITDIDRKFAAWCIKNPDKLALYGLWMEDPRWTPTWVHLQIVPPKSGKRIYIPSNKPPKAPALPGQKPIPMTIK